MPALLSVALLLAALAPAVAGEGTGPARPAAAEPARPWAEEKCVRYRRAWTDLLARRGREGLGRDFVARHEAFLASGCSGPRDVCPRSPAELEAANALVIAAMNAGAPSTFPPFACRG